MSGDYLQNYDQVSAALLNRPDVQVLSADQERVLILELDGLKKRLLDLRPMLDGTFAEEAEIQAIVRHLLNGHTAKNDLLRSLVSLAVQYNEIRTRLAMANLRLVAHVARRYQNRGIANSDLLQEGFCGLLKGIDRFQPSRDTRLASYAVWWIRQSLQRAVAAGAYPVRLNPRHLQQLAMSNTGHTESRKPGRNRARAVRPTRSARSNRRPVRRSR